MATSILQTVGRWVPGRAAEKLRAMKTARAEVAAAFWQRRARAFAVVGLSGGLWRALQRTPGAGQAEGMAKQRMARMKETWLRDPALPEESASGSQTVHTAGKRVLVVAPQPFYEDRGTPIAVLQVIEALVHLGYQVDVLTYPIGADVPLAGVRYYRCSNPLHISSVPIGFSARKVALDVSLGIALRSRLAKERYHFVHAVEEAAFIAVALADWWKVPVIYDMQSAIPEQMAKHLLFRAWPLTSLLRGAERWLLRRADAVIGSAGLAERVHDIVPQAAVREWTYASRTHVSAPEEVAAIRQQFGVSEGKQAIVYCGNFAPYQGVTELLAALPIVRREMPTAHLVLIGANGAEGAAMRQEIEARGLAEAVTLLPRVARDRVPEYLAAADILVSPRLYGGNLPLKVFDYLAAGRPIVATDIPTHRSVLDETLAELAPPRASALAESIVKLLSDPERAAALSVHARAYAESNLGWIGFVESVRDLYTAAADAH